MDRRCLANVGPVRVRKILLVCMLGVLGLCVQACNMGESTSAAQKEKANKLNNYDKAHAEGPREERPN